MTTAITRPCSSRTVVCMTMLVRPRCRGTASAISLPVLVLRIKLALSWIVNGNFAGSHVPSGMTLARLQAVAVSSARLRMTPP